MEYTFFDISVGWEVTQTEEEIVAVTLSNHDTIYVENLDGLIFEITIEDFEDTGLDKLYEKLNRRIYPADCFRFLQSNIGEAVDSPITGYSIYLDSDGMYCIQDYSGKVICKTSEFMEAFGYLEP